MLLEEHPINRRYIVGCIHLHILAVRKCPAIKGMENKICDKQKNGAPSKIENENVQTPCYAVVL